jgi:hypothetical protein
MEQPMTTGHECHDPVGAKASTKKNNFSDNLNKKH